MSPDSASTAPSALIRLVAACGLSFLLSQCASAPSPSAHADVVVSVKEQKLALYNRSGHITKTYPVSTSKFGLSDKPGTYGTPLGLHEIVAKIGHGAPSGAVFKSRNWTGEIIKPDSPGRDPIVSRIMWLRGMESINRNAYGRCIYIHGTAEERNVGKPVSYGCIRMTSRDVIDLFAKLQIGSKVLISRDGLPATVPMLPVPVTPTAPPTSQPPIFLNPQQQPESPTPAQRQLEVPTLAQGKPQSTRDTSTRTVALRQEQPAPRPAAPNPPQPKPQPLPGGGAVLYSAPTSTTPGIIMRSRKASQNLQN